MHPTMFRIPFLPEWLADIKSYGVMMMIAFLTGIWLACRRAEKSQANPDIVLNIGFIALVGGVIGSRAMYVLHYWSERFANQPSPFLSIFDIRAGGLEFYGGPLLVIPAVAIYTRYSAKASIRWYLDITMPSLAWGLAITRIGCFLNGCCWGAVCTDRHDPSHERAALPWAVRFPYGSPAMVQHYQFGERVIPKELIYVLPTGESMPLPRDYIEAALADDGQALADLRRKRAAAQERLDAAQKAGGDESALKPLRTRLEQADQAVAQYVANRPIGVVLRQGERYGLAPQELAQLSASYPSKPVHPTQLYETITAFLLCWLLGRLYYYRERHGIIGAWFLILYAVARFVLELLRQDNPLDVGGLTISQAISIGTFLTGWLWLYVVHRRLPPVSPRAVPFVCEETPVAKDPKAETPKRRR